MIRCLNLDSEFVPVPYPEVRFKTIQFPTGERQIRLDTKIDYSNIDKVVITARYSKSVGDRILMDIATAVDALEERGVKNFDIILPYFPHSRQDRITVEGEAYTLDVFSKMLHGIPTIDGWEAIHTFDMHSEKGRLNAGCKSKNNHEFIQWVLPQIKGNQRPILIVPDAGAKEKAEALYISSPSPFDTISYCSKRRDPKTGRLSGFEAGHPDYLGKPCIIVDDICDGGGTFIGLAQELKKHNAGNLYLAVSHGIFSKGLENLSSYFNGPFKKIFTTNSYRRTRSNQEMLNVHFSGYEYQIQW